MDGKAVSFGDKLSYALGNLMVYGPLRNSLGLSRVRVAYTAGEAIGPDLFTFYRSIGINLKQLYGSPRPRCSSACSPTTRPRPTPWACPSTAWRSAWPTTARSWSAARAC
jgi:long-chain acyl-CoA synthetase